MEVRENKREPLIIVTGSRGVGKSIITEHKPDAFIMAEKFMKNLKLNDTFSLNERTYFVKRIGKFHTVIKGEKKSFRKMTLKSWSKKIEMFVDDETNRSVHKSDDITFYFWGGIHGNPRSRQRDSDAKQHNFMRDIEGRLILDLLNSKNPLHEPSEIYKIASSL